MKITKRQLKRIIKEELAKITAEGWFSKKTPEEKPEEKPKSDVVRDIIRRDAIKRERQRKKAAEAVGNLEKTAKELESFGLEESEETQEEPQTMQTLLEELQELLEKWPACEDEPGGMACIYHKDLEEVVLNYGGYGCPEGKHNMPPRDEISPVEMTEI